MSFLVAQCTPTFVQLIASSNFKSAAHGQVLENQFLQKAAHVRFLKRKGYGCLG